MRTDQLAVRQPRGATSFGRRARARWWHATVFIILCILVIPFVLPFLWMVSTSFKSLDQVMRFPPEWVPRPMLWSNYPQSLTEVVPLGQYFLNTITYSVLATFGEVGSSSLIAYGFAKFRAPGRGMLFLIVISTLLIPYPVVMVPQFVLFQRLGWIDTYLPLIVPSYLGSAFLIFMLRQFMQGIPSEIIEAARIDGAGPLRIYARIMLPLSKLGLISAAILSFSYHWNNYLGPLLYINSPEKFTLQLGLASFIAYRGLSHWELLMAASVLSILPLIVIFFFAQRAFVQGIVVTGLK